VISHCKIDVPHAELIMSGSLRDTLSHQFASSFRRRPFTCSATGHASIHHWRRVGP
jgi:hypothetical protein